jgi:hypothetical protein
MSPSQKELMREFLFNRLTAENKDSIVLSALDSLIEHHPKLTNNLWDTYLKMLTRWGEDGVDKYSEFNRDDLTQKIINCGILFQSSEYLESIETFDSHDREENYSEIETLGDDVVVRHLSRKNQEEDYIEIPISKDARNAIINGVRMMQNENQF